MTCVCQHCAGRDRYNIAACLCAGLTGPRFCLHAACIALTGYVQRLLPEYVDLAGIKVLGDNDAEVKAATDELERCWMDFAPVKLSW